LKAHFKTNIFLIMMIIACLLISQSCSALELDFSGQLSLWTMETRNRGDWENNTGIRYIPQLSIGKSLNDDAVLDTEISLNGFATTEKNDENKNYELDLYRAKLRYATAQTETRVGLQKINFGPAQLLRPLRWFDRLDPTDPLQLTDGLYALRFRYDALNNAGIWLWALYGNKDPKGYERLSTVTGKPEFGGRVHYPVLGGELAATLHTRRVDGSRYLIRDYTENRFALDGQWDIGIGIWFESVFQQQEIESLIPQQRTALSTYPWTKMTTIGMDYTFGLGNGLHVLMEHMTTVISQEFYHWNENEQITAFSLNYPVGTLDNLQAIGYYSWEHNEYAQYLNWRRTYDNLVISLGLTHYPETIGNDGRFNFNPSKSGYGAQLMIIFNH